MADIKGSKDNKERDGELRNLKILAGYNFPVVKINNTYLKADEILRIEVESKNFLPTIHAELDLRSSNVLVINMPKDGDIISIYFRTSSDSYKPIRADFVINGFRSSKVSQTKVTSTDYYVKMYIEGELFIPAIKSDVEPFAFLGNSAEAMQNLAERMNLGFSINDTDPPEDKQVWYCYADTPMAYIRDIIDHSYKDDDTFYDAWIDLFYNLTFIDVNLMLGKTGMPDPSIEIVDEIHNRIGEEFFKFTDEERSKALDGLKVLTNHPAFLNSAFFIEDYNPINKSTLISKEIGYELDNNIFVSNQNLFNSGIQQHHILKTQPSYNEDKLTTHMLNRGRAADGTVSPYTDDKYADNDLNFQIKKKWGGIQYTMADTDKYDESGTNYNWSGNTHRNYKYAESFNRINKLELEKLKIEHTLMGLNLAVKKGDSIPVLLLESNTHNKLANIRYVNDNIIRLFTGWFYVTGVKYVYNRLSTMETTGKTSFRTIVTVSRREWLPPEEVAEYQGSIVTDRHLVGSLDLSSDYRIPNRAPEEYGYFEDGGLSGGGLPEDNTLDGGLSNIDDLPAGVEEKGEMTESGTVSSSTPYYGKGHELIYKIYGGNHYTVTDLFGDATTIARGGDGKHSGTDVRTWPGDSGAGPVPIYAPFNGTITFRNINVAGGQQMFIEDDKKTVKLGFAHLSKFLKPTGYKFRQGEILAMSGGSGGMKRGGKIVVNQKRYTPHNHITVRYGDGSGKYGNKTALVPEVRKKHIKPYQSDTNFVSKGLWPPKNKK